MKTQFAVAIVLSMVIACTQSQAQEALPAAKSVYGEIGGAGLAFSANFDGRFMGHKGIGYRVGAGFLPLTNRSIITIPLGINVLLGKGSSFFEAEVTGTFVSASAKFKDNVTKWFVYPHVGYRYAKPSGGFLFRLNAGPLLLSGHVYPWAGLSFGYELKNHRH